MKTRRWMLICILSLAVLIIFGSCATTQNPDKMVFEKFCGTWANESYDKGLGAGSFRGAKWILNPDGSFVTYAGINETGTAGSNTYGSYTVEKRWTDSEGKSCYNIKLEFAESVLGKGNYYVFCKLIKSSSTLEGAISNVDYPDSIDRSDRHSTYFILYRY